MELKSLKTLEFDKILERLCEYAINDDTKKMILEYVPFETFDEVNRVLSETDMAMVLCFKFGSPQIGKVAGISGAIKRAEIGGVLSMPELLNIANVLRSADNLKRYYSGHSGALDEYFGALVPNRNIEERISTSIISEDEMADGASAELSSIRRKIKNAGAKVKESLNSMIHSPHYQKFLQEPIVTMRNDRYVLPVKAECKADVSGIVHDMSASGSTLFIEPTGVVNANNELRELEIREKKEIEKILADLTGAVVGILDTLEDNFDGIMALDFIFARAKYAIAIRGVKPELNTEGKLLIKNGRHPLLDAKKVVPENINLGYDFDSLIVTGPNTGGKTVVLKTIGLFCLMAQAGILVPGDDGTTLPVFSDIFADIGDEQSIEQSLSTFSAHMKNIVSILNKLTPDSLVLFDEIGAGTDPIEGAALATAILEYVKGFGAKTVATTHYSELKIYALSTPRVENASCEFDVNTLSPTYRLLIGVPGKSNAFAISKRLGISDYIINRSKALISEENVKFEDILSNIEKNRQSTEKARREQEKLRAEIARLKNETEKERDKLANKREEILGKAKEKASKIIEDAKTETENLLNEVKEAQKQKDTHEARRAMEEVRKELGAKLKKTKKPVQTPRRKSNVNINTLKPGASVLIIDLNDKGSVLSINKKDNTAVIQVGIMKTTAKISNLVVLEDETVKNLMRFVPKKNESIGAREVKTEIDLRGETLEEALDKVDRFLDSVSRAGISPVTIIHGKGTGVLRKGVQDMLRNHPQVKSYRLGRYGEGENGVTIVEIK